MSYSAGMAAYKSGDLQKAINEFHQAVEQDESDHKAWNAYGVVLTRTGHYEEADTCYDNALKISPDTAAYQRNRDKNRLKMEQEDIIEVDDGPVIKAQQSKSKPVSNQLPLNRPWWHYAAGVFVFVILIAFVAGMSGGSHKADTYQPSQVNSPNLAGNSITFQPTQQATNAPVQVIATPPTVEQTQNRVTLGERNAARKAKDYLNVLHFSREGLIKQLEGFEGFSHAEATYGVDQTGADWNEQAAGKAKDYLDVMAFSRDALIKQLVDFEGFTRSQAEYGANAAGY